MTKIFNFSRKCIYIRTYCYFTFIISQQTKKKKNESGYYIFEKQNTFIKKNIFILQFK